jgi:hypothetical protein
LNIENEYVIFENVNIKNLKRRPHRMDISENKSEVARLRWQIEQTCQAMQRVMNDPGFSASHESIRRRYEHLGQQEQELARHVGEEQAHDMTYAIYNDVMESENGIMREQVNTSELPGNEAIQPEQDTLNAVAGDTRGARISVEGGEPQLLIITLPEFRRGYETGKQALLSDEGEQPFLIDTELIELLKDFAAEGLFTSADETALHWHIGNLLGQIDRSALHVGTQVQRMIIQAKDNLVLTIALTPLQAPG